MNSVHLPHLKAKNVKRCSGCWKCESRERKCDFSLYFQPIGPSVFDGARSKSIYAARATRGHRFGGVPITPRDMDLFLLVLFFG